MGCYYILAANANVDIPGGRSFIGQLITFLLGEDLIVYTAVCLGIVAFCVGVKAFIEIMED